jgi:hypothetical protein
MKKQGVQYQIYEEMIKEEKYNEFNAIARNLILY